MKKNDYKRLNFKKLEKQNLIFKILSNNMILDMTNKEKSAKTRHSYGKNSSITLVRNNCINTGRNRGILPNYRLSRLEFKKFISSNYIGGIRKI
jgi:ribosomal protein S14